MTGAYPWLTPVVFNVIVAMSLSVWMIVTDIILLRSKPF